MAKIHIKVTPRGIKGRCVLFFKFLYVAVNMLYCKTHTFIFDDFV
jgi:hypothetical protein